MIGLQLIQLGGSFKTIRRQHHLHGFVIFVVGFSLLSPDSSLFAGEYY